MRLRVYLISLVLAVAIPLLAVALVSAHWLISTYQHATEEKLKNTARALALAIHNQVAASTIALIALAESPALDDNDLADFYTHARRLGEATGGWVVLADRATQQIVNTRVPLGSPLPRATQSDIYERVFAAGKPVVSDLFDGPIVRRPIVGVFVPALRDNTTIYALAVAIEPAELSRLLDEQHLPNGDYAVLWDGAGRIIARSSDAEARLGQFVPEQRRSGQPLVRTENFNGDPFVMAAEQVPGTPWSLGVAVPQAQLEAEGQRPLAILLIAGGGLIVAGSVLAFLLSRILLGPVNALASAAAAVTRGREASAGTPFRIAEFERLRLALIRASTALHEEARATALTAANADLEQRIAERTRELTDAAAKLRESTARYRAYVDNSPYALFVVRSTDGDDFIFEDISRSAERLVQRSAADFIGKRLTECLPGKEADIVLQNWRRCIERSTPVHWEQDVEFPAGPRRIETIVVPTYDENTRVHRLFGSSRDVTERHEMEARLRRAERLEAMGLMASGLAHDFKNMLTGIGSQIELISKHADDPKRVRRHTTTALGGIRRSTEMIANMLAFARSQAPSIALQDVNAALRAFEPMARHAVDPSITLMFDLEPVAGHCRTDLAQLESAILNLIINAADAMREGGQITVRTRQVDLSSDDLTANPDAVSGSFMAIIVEDTGTGMAPEIAARVFEPFFTTKESGEGTGLGLSQVMQFARQAGGLAKIDAAPGRGTIVTVYLACEIPQANSGDAPRYPSAPRHGAGIAS